MILQYILFRGMIAVTITTIIAVADNIRRAERKRREKRRRREQCERREREEIPIIPRDRAPLADYVDEAKLPIIFSTGVQPISAQEAADGTRAYSAKEVTVPKISGVFTCTARLYADDKVIEEIEQEI